MHFPVVDLERTANPIPAIVDAPEFESLTAYFAAQDAASRSLISPNSQALLYSLVRNQKPDHVVEIGTYRGGTTEALARALQDNARGTVHTVGPYDADHFWPVYGGWPMELKERVKFYGMSSMSFYMEAEAAKLRAGLIFVDGNHDYEFALFDVQAGSRRIVPGGFIVVDNIAQAGPFLAMQDFLARNPGWTHCTSLPFNPRSGFAHDRHRTGIKYTDFSILRAPTFDVVGARPWTAGETIRRTSTIEGVDLLLQEPATGTLHVQFVFRAFGSGLPAELVDEAVAKLDGTSREVRVPLPLAIEGAFDRYTVELWLIWDGERPLHLARRPEIL